MAKMNLKNTDNYALKLIDAALNLNMCRSTDTKESQEGQEQLYEKMHSNERKFISSSQEFQFSRDGSNRCHIKHDNLDEAQGIKHMDIEQHDEQNETERALNEIDAHIKFLQNKLEEIAKALSASKSDDTTVTLFNSITSTLDDMIAVTEMEIYSLQSNNQKFQSMLDSFES